MKFRLVFIALAGLWIAMSGLPGGFGSRATVLRNAPPVQPVFPNPGGIGTVTLGGGMNSLGAGSIAISLPQIDRQNRATLGVGSMITLTANVPVLAHVYPPGLPGAPGVSGPEVPGPARCASTP